MSKTDWETEAFYIAVCYYQSDYSAALGYLSLWSISFFLSLCEMDLLACMLSAVEHNYTVADRKVQLNLIWFICFELYRLDDSHNTTLSQHALLWSPVLQKSPKLAHLTDGHLFPFGIHVLICLFRSHWSVEGTLVVIYLTHLKLSVNETWYYKGFLSLLYPVTPFLCHKKISHDPNLSCDTLSRARGSLKQII